MPYQNLCKSFETGWRRDASDQKRSMNPGVELAVRQGFRMR